jgi:hypothetical protein
MPPYRIISHTDEEKYHAHHGGFANMFQTPCALFEHIKGKDTLHDCCYSVLFIPLLLCILGAEKGIQISSS